MQEPWGESIDSSSMIYSMREIRWVALDATGKHAKITLGEIVSSFKAVSIVKYRSRWLKSSPGWLATSESWGTQQTCCKWMESILYPQKCRNGAPARRILQTVSINPRQLTGGGDLRSAMNNSGKMTQITVSQITARRFFTLYQRKVRKLIEQTRLRAGCDDCLNPGN